MKKITFLLTLLSATSFGQAFTKITNFPVSDAKCTWVFSTSESNAFVTLFGTSALYHTYNGGATWDSTTLGPDVYDLTDVYFADSLNGWVVGSVAGAVGNGKLFKTTDGGVNWDDVSVTVNGDSGISKFAAIRFNGFNGIIGASNGFVDADNLPLYYRTTNGGASWTKVHSMPGMAKGDAFEITRISNNPIKGTFQLTGAYASFSNIVLNSLDNGASFKLSFSEYTAPGDNDPLDIFNIDGSNTVYWIATNKPKKSIDGGATFMNFTYPVAVPFLSAFFDTPEEGYIVGEQSGIYKTTDGGKTWIKLHDEMPGYRLRNIFRAGRSIWAVGEQGAIYKATLPGMPTALSALSVKPVRIYPNPAQDFIVLDGNSTDKIQLFNIGGQEVTELVQTSVLPGGEIKIAVKNLAHGTYFIKKGVSVYKVNKN